MIPVSSSLFTKRKAQESAQSLIRPCQSESQVLERLIENEPDILKCGDEQWINKTTLEKDIKDMAFKLKMNGHTDRAERFTYLASALESKWSKKPDQFKIMMRFLLEMSKNPTNILNLRVSSEKFSPNETLPDEEMTAESVRKYLKDISFFSNNGDNTLVENGESDSELSEWSVSEEEVVVKEKPLKLTHSQSLDFKKDITFEEDLERERDLYWTLEFVKGNNCVESSVHQPQPIPFEYQPVISTFCQLHSKFGQFWEWKQKSNSISQDCILPEIDIVKELLWQFSSPNKTDSFIFNSDWSLKDDLFIASLSKSSLVIFLTKYEEALRVMDNLKDFTRSTLAPETLKSQPNTYKAYAEGIHQILEYIRGNVSKIESELRLPSSSKTLLCSTLKQLDSQMRPNLQIIHFLKDLHEKSIISDWAGKEEWICSLKLISSLESHLLLQTNLLLYQIVFFLYIKSTITFLKDIFILFKLYEWEHSRYLFLRNEEINLNHANFWKDSITINSFSVLEEWGLNPPLFLKDLAEKFITLLKTAEVLKELDQDPSKILGSLPSPNDIISEFLEMILKGGIGASTTADEEGGGGDNLRAVGCLESLSELEPHFQFLNLNSCPALGAYDFILGNEEALKEKLPIVTRFTLNQFLSLKTYPILETAHILREQINNTIVPFYNNARESLVRIFQENKLEESFKLFREIILGGREDFADAVLQILTTKQTCERFKYDDEMGKNSDYQKVLNECYPEGRENFRIILKINPQAKMGHEFEVTPLFPLNLALNQESIKAYLFISEQLMRIRKSLKIVNMLQFKDCKVDKAVPLRRVLLFRFSLIHFCSSFRAFFMLKIFGKHIDVSSICDTEGDLESIFKAHEVEYHLFESQLINAILLKKMEQMAEGLGIYWRKGIHLRHIITLEDNLKKCWLVINDFSKRNYRHQYDEFATFFGSPPAYLVN